MTITELNGLDPETFSAQIGWVFEHSPWVCERAAAQRPFESLEDLCRILNSQVLAADRAQQQELLRAHPDLATKARIAAGSAREQAGAGLDRLAPDEYDCFLRLNSTYKEKFGFPFLLAVKGSDKFAIMDAMRRRTGNTVEEEFEEALRQVFRIVRFRLQEMIT